MQAHKQEYRGDGLLKMWFVKQVEEVYFKMLP